MKKYLRKLQRIGEFRRDYGFSSLSLRSTAIPVISTRVVWIAQRITERGSERVFHSWEIENYSPRLNDWG
jgi:hypothetical protein